MKFFAFWIGSIVLCSLVSITVGATAPRQAREPAHDSAASVSIALLSDTHASLDANESAYDDHLKTAITEVNALHPDSVLIAGDLTQSGKSNEVSDFQGRIKGFTSPVRYVFGNHDVGAKHIAGKPGGVSEARVNRIEAQLGPSFWSDTISNGQNRIRVVGVDSSLLGSGLGEEAAQNAFLQAELAKPDAPLTVILMHYPPYLESPDEEGGGYWNLEKQPRADFLHLVSQPSGKVIALLCGHLHRPLDRFYGSIRMVNAPAISFGLPKGTQPEGWLLLTISSAGVIHTEFHSVTHS